MYMYNYEIYIVHVYSLVLKSSLLILLKDVMYAASYLMELSKLKVHLFSQTTFDMIMNTGH